MSQEDKQFMQSVKKTANLRERPLQHRVAAKNHSCNAQEPLYGEQRLASQQKVQEGPGAKITSAWADNVAGAATPRPVPDDQLNQGRQAESEIIKFSQRQQFNEEPKHKQKGKQGRNSQLFRLTLYFKTILRVGGRLQQVSHARDRLNAQPSYLKHSRVATLILQTSTKGQDTPDAAMSWRSQDASIGSHKPTLQSESYSTSVLCAAGSLKGREQKMANLLKIAPAR
ncbi:hypothetical protein AAFF_G00261400 [Aldrovandia affinis]|uniref:Uncharacterized protein n=1 Tax=Aldrovandia affinis TaxID=143900 RepID=A0AAD7RC14_9TELE|nr:hypothetical protein AAFF_G00261400 [Aldrovandia affinis]